jgi:large subunit ribosomal protein L20
MRVRIGSARRKRRRKLRKLTKGFYSSKHRTYRQMKESAMRAGMHSYFGRKVKKRQMRSLWIIRIGAALTGKGINYNRFINGLKKANICLNRKVLADLAISDKVAFDKIVEVAKAHL